eukprot:tig00000849_g4787.t1
MQRATSRWRTRRRRARPRRPRRAPPAPAANQIVRTTPADVERLESPVARRAVVQISPQILVEHAGGAGAPSARSTSLTLTEQLKNAKKEYLAGVLARCETLAQLLDRGARRRRPRRLLGLKGFHVYVRDADLVAAVEGPGAAVYAKEDLDQWWASPRAPLAAARPRHVQGGTVEGREALSASSSRLRRSAGSGDGGAAGKEGVLDLAPFRVNSAAAPTSTATLDLLLPRGGTPGGRRRRGDRGDVRLHATRPDPLLVAWNSDEWRWLRELAREIAPSTPSTWRPRGRRPPPPPKPRAPPGPPAPPTLDRRARRGGGGGGRECGGRDAEDEATISEGVVERSGSSRAGRARAGLERRPRRGRAAAAAPRSPTLFRRPTRTGASSAPTAGPRARGDEHVGGGERIPGVLAATAHCYSLRCAGEPLLGALAWAQPGAFGGASTLAQADAALLGLHATVARIADRSLQLAERLARAAAAAAAAEAQAAAAAAEGEGAGGRAPGRGRRGAAPRKLFIDQTSGEARSAVRCASGRAARRRAAGAGLRAAGARRGRRDRAPPREDEVDMFSLRLFPEQAKSMGAGTFGATARNPYWAELPQGAVDYLDAVVAWLRTLGAARRSLRRRPERRVRPAASGPGSFPLEDGATGGPAARLRAMLPDLATWRAALRLPSSPGPSRSRRTLIPSPDAGSTSTSRRARGPALLQPAPILARLDGGGRRSFVPGAPPRVLYVTAGRVQPDILVKDPRFAALSYPSASGERVPVAWTVYKEARPEELADASFVMCTVQSGRRLEGDFDVVIVDEGRGPSRPSRRAGRSRGPSTTRRRSPGRRPLRRAPPGGDVISYLKRGSNDARLRWTAIDIRYAAAVIAAKLLAGEVGYIACSTRRALWEIESIVRRHMRLSGRRCEFLYADADRRARQTMTDSDYRAAANFVAYIEEGRTADVNAGFQLGRPLHAPVDWRAIYGELVDSVRAWNERLPAERRVATEEHYLRVRAVRTALRNATHAAPSSAARVPPPGEAQQGGRPSPIGDCARRLLHDLVVHAAEQLGLGVLVAAADARRVVRGGARRTVKRTRYCFDPRPSSSACASTGAIGTAAGRPARRDARGAPGGRRALLQIALVQDPKSKLRAAGAGGGGGEGGEGGAPGAPAEAGARPRPSDAAQRVFRLLKSGVHSAVFFSQAARAVLARAAASEAPEALAPIAPPSAPAPTRRRGALRADLARAALAMDDGAARDGLGFPAAEESPALPTEDATWLLCRLAEAAGAPPSAPRSGAPHAPSSGIDVARTGSDTSGISLFVDGAARLLPEDLARPRVARGPRSCGAKMLLFVPRSTFQHFGVPLLALPPRPAPAPTPAPPA